MLALCLMTALAVQDPVETKPADTKPVAQTAFETWDDARTRTELAEFKKKTKGRRVPLATRAAAVEALAKGCNQKLVKPLATVVKTDKALTVRKTAAAALAHQPEKAARPAILKLLGDSSVKKAAPVVTELIGALDRCGYRSKDWDKIDNLFERDYGTDWVPTQRAILQLIKNHKETEAIDLLLRNLGEPIPANVDDPSNPPAEYWEKRWKAWQVWREDVKRALYAITGQRFSTPEEARAWIKKNGRKIGIR